jgi:hypothetical protein
MATRQFYLRQLNYVYLDRDKIQVKVWVTILKFDLLQNAKDSLKNAVHVLAWPDGPESEKLKHAILSVSHCAEMLLKERLRRIDPEHIYERRSLASSNRRTITSERAIYLLETVGAITIDTKGKDALDECRNIRNQIEHNEFGVTHNEIKVVVAKTLSFIFFFGSEQLGNDLEKEFKSDDTWDMLLQELYEFTEEFGSRISTHLYAEGISIESSDNCGQETADLSRGFCALCGHYYADTSNN